MQAETVPPISPAESSDFMSLFIIFTAVYKVSENSGSEYKIMLLGDMLPDPVEGILPRRRK